jgi:hypothetical protein
MLKISKEEFCSPHLMNAENYWLQCYSNISMLYLEYLGISDPIFTDGINFGYSY